METGESVNDSFAAAVGIYLSSIARGQSLCLRIAGSASNGIVRILKADRYSACQCSEAHGLDPESGRTKDDVEMFPAGLAPRPKGQVGSAAAGESRRRLAMNCTSHADKRRLGQVCSRTFSLEKARQYPKLRNPTIRGTFRRLAPLISDDVVWIQAWTLKA